MKFWNLLAKFIGEFIGVINSGHIDGIRMEKFDAWNILLLEVSVYIKNIEKTLKIKDLNRRK